MQLNEYLKTYCLTGTSRVQRLVSKGTIQLFKTTFIIQILGMVLKCIFIRYLLLRLRNRSNLERLQHREGDAVEVVIFSADVYQVPGIALLPILEHLVSESDHQSGTGREAI